MLEGTPSVPFGSNGQLLSSLCEIEDSMKYRRREAQSVLDEDETVMSITNFPRLGCPGYTYPVYHPKPESSDSGSVFWPDEAIYTGHPRFASVTKNVRARLGRKVFINLPIFKDKNTKDPFIENFCEAEAKLAAKPNHVYMDAMGFGMGCCCLQVTFQATHLEQARNLYDQMIPLAPIVMALSAASPIYRGYLTDRDCRWDVIAGSVDDRTSAERCETAKSKESGVKIAKSRYDSVSTYVSKQGQNFNDIPLVINRNYYESMVCNKVDPLIARHIAHLFIRDPLVVYREKLHQKDTEIDHYENISSTNWQTLRLKPPPSDKSPIGWRVEFRPIEAQTTDFENAAYVVFMTLLTRVILAYKLNFLMPLSLVDENMVTAQKRNSVEEHKFWFRKDIMHKSKRLTRGPLGTVVPEATCCFHPMNTDSNHNNTRSFTKYDQRNGLCQLDGKTITETEIKKYFTKMTINEIMNGCDGFVGIIPIVVHYVESLNDGSNTDQIATIKKYLKLISDRASLKVQTMARFIRDFVSSHPKYNHDSVVSDEINYDLLKLLKELEEAT